MMKLIFAFFVAIFAGNVAMADNTTHPNVEPWQLNFQEAVTPVMERITALHDALTVTITIITVFVLILLLYVIYRFSEKRNKKPSKTSHNTVIEIIWTVVPILILVAIAIPSLRLHYYMDKAVDPDMSLKVVGYQWYWNYSYPDHDDLSFDSYMIKDEDLKPNQPRLLAVDNPIVVPVGKTVAVHVTGGDVIHAWAMPAFGVKTDAIPGRANETWFRADKEGVYYGQCSEICGVGHGFMPIEVHVVSQAAYDLWLESAKQQFANGGDVKSRDLLLHAQSRLAENKGQLALTDEVNKGL